MFKYMWVVVCLFASGTGCFYDPNALDGARPNPSGCEQGYIERDGVCRVQNTEGCEPGTIDCACRVDGACDVGLECVSELCRTIESARPDMPEDMVDMPEDMVDMPVACEPLVECPADTCGMLDDGCGGVLDCGVCLCEGGQPTSLGCGVCGLGTQTCGAGEGDPNVCQEGALEDLDAAVCSKLLYVVAGANAQNADGTRDRPFASLSAALAKANRELDQGAILMSSGSFTEPEPLEIVEGIAVFGSRDASTWRLTEDATTIRIAPGEERTVGVIASNVTQTTTIGDLEFVTDLATTGNNYGVVAKASPGLRLVGVSIRVGGAPDGERGSDGIDGANGLDGTDAGSAIWGQLEVDQALDRAYNGAFPGKGGENASCPDANGGDGGYGARGSFVWNSDFTEMVFLEHLARAGHPSIGGVAGGGSGRSDSPNGEPGNQANSASPNGMNGNHGSAQGELSDGWWVLLSGDGQQGDDGSHGVGGGGGGGSWWPTSDTSDHKYGEMPGGSGGGGGAGGCAGTGGAGGTAGGSSIGMLAINSTGMQLSGVSIQVGDAGDGGNGGRGGLGGASGRGGRGTQLSNRTAPGDNFESSHPRSSGNGGLGSVAGDGGAGGAGAGGSSIGLVCDNSMLTRGEDLDIRLGDAGRGGQGGEDGKAVESLGCP